MVVIFACAWAALGAGCGKETGTVGHDAGADPDTGAAADGGDAGADRPGDTPTGAVDCRAVCDRIATICEGMSTIDENWLSICRQNCEVRLSLKPDTARAEEACVWAAADCATAVLCSVDPLGGG